MRFLIAIMVTGALASLQISTVFAEEIVTGDFPITTEMYNNELELLSSATRKKYLQSLPNTGLLVNDLYSRQRVVNEALKRGLDKDPLVLKKFARARQAVLVEALADDIKSNMAAPDFEGLARERYNLNKDKYVSKEEVRASHILLRVSEGSDAQAARARADELLVELKGGADFASLASKHSEDQGSAAAGGDLGWFTQGKMVRQFDKAVFSLQSPGDLSEVVVTEFGFHIILLTGRKDPAPRSFDEVKTAMMFQMAKAYEAEELARQMKEIADFSGADANIEAMDRAYQAARKKYMQAR